MVDIKELERIKARMIKTGYDTVVRCKKCGRTQYLMFKNGLTNGWSKCCGYTMPIIIMNADVEKEVKTIVSKIKGVKTLGNFFPSMEND